MISFKKLTTQEMVDRGIKRYIYISSNILVAGALVTIFLIGSAVLLGTFFHANSIAQRNIIILK